MTTLTIILISIIVYLVIAFIWCFIASVTNTLLDTEDLLCCLFWIIVLPCVVIKGLILRFTK